MTILEPGLLAPELAYPNRKPLRGVQIDWTNPLSRGLSLCLVMQDNEAKDLVSGKSCARYADARHIDEGMYFDEVGDYLIFPDLVMNEFYSISTLLNHDDNTGSAYQYFFSYGAAATANSINLYFGESSANGTVADKISFVTDSSSETRVIRTNSLFPDNNNVLVTATGGGDTTGDLYINGALDEHSTLGSSNMLDGTTKDLYIGGRTDLNADRFTGGTLKIILIHDRRLSDEEVRVLADNPYQVLKPLYKPILKLRAAVAGITIALGLVTETNSVQAVNVAKALELGLNTESDSTLALSIAKALSVAQVVETGTAQAFSHKKSIEIGVANEADNVFSLGYVTSILVNQIKESDSAQDLNMDKRYLINLVTETDSSLAALLHRHISIGQVSEADIARALDILKSVAIDQVSEADIARALDILKSVAIDQVSETNSSLDIISPSVITIYQTSENDEAINITLTGGLQVLGWLLAKLRAFPALDGDTEIKPALDGKAETKPAISASIGVNRVHQYLA